jgi:DNA mismatch repair protein MutS
LSGGDGQASSFRLGADGAQRAGLTPALRQYFEAKEASPDSILFFQMGDFYELFFDDAELVAPILDLALTSRQKLGGRPVPLCGVPLSAGEGYINRLVAMGHKVAVCDQVGKTGPGGGLAQRRLSRVVTPATVLSAEAQSPALARFLAALGDGDGGYALAAVDLSTGDFVCGRFGDLPSLRAAVASLGPAEVAVGEEAPPGLASLADSLDVLVSRLPMGDFDPAAGQSELLAALGPGDAARALDGWPAMLAAAGAALSYLRRLSGGAGLSHLAAPRLPWETGFMVLDEAATRNLELFRPARDGNARATLIAQIDLTRTPMGARLIRDWLARPLVDRAAIEARHEAVAALAGALLSRRDLEEALAGGGDLERALGRLALGRGTVRDLGTIRATLELAPGIRGLLLASPSGLLSSLGGRIDPLGRLRDRIAGTLADDIPPGASSGLVRDGVSPRLDALRDLETGGRREIAALEASERRRTGIGNLKIGFNKVFGYYLEVTRSNLANVPGDWTRRQTIAGGERFVTAELKDWEEKILSAGERRSELEARIVENLKAAAAAEAPGLKALAAILAEADAICSLAACAEKWGWVRPSYTGDDLLDIRGGRHPVVERFLPAGEAFVANDVLISHKERLLIITGPNMAGKSTILRQTALIAILGQMGSFVPAERAVLSIRDQVFTRVGASDDLARGQSTFMVEMSETADILRKATNRSLVILDEVGRGTSTYDGLAIAWAVAEHLHDLGGRGVPTLFATHYHELTELPRHKHLARNYNVSAKRWGQTVVFLRKLVPGGVNRSYGLDVAALAGLPQEVVRRAREVLSDLGRQSPNLIKARGQRESLFSASGLDQDGPSSLAREISQIKTEELSPIAALNLLVDLKSRAREVLS